MPAGFKAATRFPWAVSTSGPGTLLGNFKIPNPLDPYVFVDDFSSYVAADWTVTTAGGGSTALAAGNGGRVLQTTGAAGSDIQFNLKNPAAFKFVAGCQFWFVWGGKITDLASILQVGVQAGGTALAPTDGVFFNKAAGSANVDLVIRAASVSTTISAVTTLAADTDAALGFYYNGAATPTLYVFSSTPVQGTQVAFSNNPPYYIGGVQVYGVGAQSPISQSLANLPTANVAPGFGIGGSAATAAETMNTDYILCSTEILRY